MARLVDLQRDDGDVLLAGVPYDVSVIGRKGAVGGPAGIREAFRFIATGHPDGSELVTTFQDVGDVSDLPDSVLAAHAAVEEAAGAWFASGKRVILLGGDHGLTYPHVAALRDRVEGSIGIVVIDAHYDLREHEGEPTSGTPFRRLLAAGHVRPNHLVEIGIRPFANAPELAAYAKSAGIHIHSMAAVRRDLTAVLEATMEALADVDHIWLSIDIDGFDQSIASGCSAPGAGGLTFDEGAAILQTVASDPRCRGMDLLEVAPTLDPTGNTCRTAAQLVAHAMHAFQI